MIKIKKNKKLQNIYMIKNLKLIKNLCILEVLVYVKKNKIIKLSGSYKKIFMDYKYFIYIFDIYSLYNTL